MANTNVDLVTRALGLLGVTQVGQDPSAEDVELVMGYIAGKIADLTDRRIVVITSNAITPEQFLPFAKIIANAAGPEFGRAFDPDTDDREETRLNRQQATFTRRREVLQDASPKKDP